MTTDVLADPRQGRFTPMIWRALAWFWCAVVVIAGAAGGWLQYLGPMHRPVVSVASVAPPPPPAAPKVVMTPEAVVAPPAPAAHLPGMIAPPDPALAEPSVLYPGGVLPKIGADHRTPLQAYAAGFAATDTRPHVALLIAGIGMNEAESTAAISLPRAVSFAVTPYAQRLDPLLDAVRAGGHELLVSIPMEPQGFPLNDPGNRALLTGAAPLANAQRLEWALTRFAGYVGATGALGDMRGERFAAARDQMAPLLDTLAERGLMYVDPRPNAMRVTGPPLGTAARGAFRGVDLVIDDPPGPAELDRALARLEQIARDRGSALGLAGRPSPVTVDRISIWSLGLSARGLTLAPVSVVAQMPQAPSPLLRINLAK